MTEYNLIHAARSGNTRKVQELVESYGLSHSLAWSDGYVLLRHALENGHVETGKLLLTYDCKVNNKSGKPTNTPLHFAVKTGGAELVAMLLKKGAKVNFQNAYKVTPLHIAAGNGHIEIVKMLVDAYSDINPIDKYDNTPFIEAIRGGHVQIVDFFLKRGTFINMVSCYYDSPLHLALKKTNEDIFVLLLTNGANPNIKNRGITPLHVTAEKGLLKYTEHLLKYGAHVDSTDEEGSTPLHLAVKQGHKDIIFLLMENGADVNIQNATGKSILYTASEKGFLEIAKHLLKHCPDVNKESNRRALIPAVCGRGVGQGQIVESLLGYGFSIIAEDTGNHELLCRAIEKGCIKIVEDLLKFGVDINLKLNTSWPRDCTLLHIAARNKQIQIAQMLIKHGININVKDDHGKTSLFYAVESDLEMTKLLLVNGANIEDCDLLISAIKKNCGETLNLLLHHGADSNVCDKYGRTALHFTVSQNRERIREDIVELLIKHGANINALDKNGETTFHYAAKEGDAKVIEVLLKYDADVNCSNKNNETALHLSARQGNELICEMLLNKGADISDKTIRGDTALYIASKKGHVQVVHLLLKYGSDINIRNKDNTTAFQFVLGYLRVLKDKIDNDDDDHFYSYHDDYYSYRGDCGCNYNNDLYDDYDSRYNYDYSHYERTKLYKNFQNFSSIRGIFINLIVKMINAGLYVDTLNLSCFNRHLSDTVSLQNKCQEEIESMKEKVANTTVSFRDILTDNINHLVSYAGNENILQLLESDEYEVKFPVYGSMVKTYIRKGLRRRELLERKNQIFHVFFADLPELPYNCIEKILNHLSDEDLKMFTLLK